MELCGCASTRLPMRSTRVSPQGKRKKMVLANNLCTSCWALEISSSLMSRRRLFSHFAGFAGLLLLQEAEASTKIGRYRKLDNGVKIEEVVEGEGPKAQEGDLVEVNYVCRRSNGYFVHSTVDQFSGESRPVILPLDNKQIIQGLKDVIVGMKAGEFEGKKKIFEYLLLYG